MLRSAPAAGERVLAGGDRGGSARVRRVVFALLGAWLAAYLVHGIVAPRMPVPVVFDKRGHDLVLLVSAGLCLWRALAERAERVAWLLIGTALLSWSLGEVYYTLVLWNRDPIPIPSLADLGYLAFVPLGLAGFVALLRARGVRPGVSDWFDGATAAFAAAAISAALVLHTVQGSVTGPPLAIATNLAYPIGDLLLLGMAVAAFAFNGWRVDRTWLTLGLGVVAFTVADGYYLVASASSGYQPGGPMDLGWWVGILLLAVAAWQPNSGARDTPSRRRTLAMPLLFAILGLLLLLAARLTHVGFVAIAFAALSVLSVMLRLVWTSRRLAGTFDQLHHALAGVHASEAMKAAVIDSALDCLIIMDADGSVVDWNPAAETTFGYTRAEAVGRELAELVVPSHLRDRHRAGLAQFLASGEPRILGRRVELTAVRADQTEFPVELTITAVPGARPLFTGYLRDITERQQARERLEAIAGRHAAVAELGERALGGLDLERLCSESLRLLTCELGVDFAGVWQRENEAVLTCIAADGWEPARGDGPAAAAPGSLAVDALTATAPIAAADFAVDRHVLPPPAVADAGGRSGIAVAIPGPGHAFGSLTGYSRAPRAFTADDMTFMQSVANVLGAAIGREQSELDLRHLALHDGLTGLPNRTLLLDRVGQGIARDLRHGTHAALLFVDIDRFKLVNDTLGHQAGDELLVAIAARLDETLRAGDTLARLGGDEFVVFAPDLNSGEDAPALALRIVEAFERPFELAGMRHFASASVGVALADQPGDADGLLRNADVAMYHAKQRGGGRFEMFRETMLSPTQNRLFTENELRRALDRGELRLRYQPIVSLPDRRIVAVEALVRWKHPERGLIPPVEFIPIAEQTGLIVPLGEWILGEACSAAARWNASRANGEKVRVSVNLSPRQAAESDLVETVTNSLAAAGLAPALLGLEITETLLLDDTNINTRRLVALHDLGVKILLDDFGTGYSSLTHVKRLPIDVIKIDRSFISGLASRSVDSAIVQAVIGMAGALEKTVVAEGVETDEQAERLLELEVRLAQGYLFAPPLAERELRELLEHRGGDTPSSQQDPDLMSPMPR